MQISGLCKSITNQKALEMVWLQSPACPTPSLTEEVSDIPAVPGSRRTERHWGPQGWCMEGGRAEGSIYPLWSARQEQASRGAYLLSGARITSPAVSSELCTHGTEAEIQDLPMVSMSQRQSCVCMNPQTNTFSVTSVNYQHNMEVHSPKISSGPLII